MDCYKLDMEDFVRNIVSNVTASAEGQAKSAAVACDHQRLELYARPCLKCQSFCNCRYTYLPKFYPDVLVRSVDKHIVLISGNLVRASATLSSLVDQFSGAKSVRPLALDEETVMIERDVDGGGTTKSAVTSKGSENAATGMKFVAHLPTTRIRDTAKKMKLFRNEKLVEEINFSRKDAFEMRAMGGKVLTLYDVESDQPTFGITRDIFKKLDYYINKHLNDVDLRVQTKKLNQFSDSKEACFFKDSIPSGLLDELVYRDVNTFQFEDWEEEFFNVSPGTFFDLHKANQELLIWDLYYAIEKWMVLFRGYPKSLVNGKYDIFSDPDGVNDKNNVYGLYGIPYPNPYRKSWHLRSRLNISHFNRVGCNQRWWSASRQQEGIRK